MTIYMANPVKAALPSMQARELGFIDTPAQGNLRPKGVIWCADNGCFGKGWPGYEAWVAWLKKNSHAAGDCLFATAPDVVGEAELTLARSEPWLPVIRELGYPAALVAQDGVEKMKLDWDSFDVLFLGGSTEWKLSPEAAELVAEAKRHGKKVHMGRVNSRKRYRYAKSIGCDSVDGTFLVFGPEVNLPKLLSWVHEGQETMPQAA